MLARSGDRTGVVSHQVQNQAENPLRQDCGDGDGQGKNGDENERFHWTCYRQVSTKEQREIRGLGRNLNPRAFSCFDEQARADETLDDASGGVGRNV